MTLELLGANRVMPYKGGFRSSCPIHHGDGDKAFAVWVDDSGDFRASCHSHQCVKAASLEWVVAKSKVVGLREAVDWLSTQLGRNLVMPDTKDRGIHLVPAIRDDISFCDLDALTRLRSVYPNHPYWISRGYSPEIIAEYQLTYRGIDQRMVIPVMDENNGFVGMMTRATDPNDPLKYKWESPNSSKAAWLYGVPQALKRPMIFEGRRVVFLVEGTLDVLHGAARGYPVVASQTNRLSSDQVQQLLSHWDLVVIIPDNDEPGQHLVSDAKKLAGPFMEIAVVVLPKGIKDLDDYPQPHIANFLNNIIDSWRIKWQEATRRTRSFLTLSPLVFLDSAPSLSVQPKAF